MVFKCQEDSFLQEFTSEVISCCPAKFETLVDGKKVKQEGYEIICKDTIIFPEGGGQPFDQGYLNDKWVHQVIRKGDQALHYTTEPLNPGDVVKQKIVWQRRFDHMQQHSGQHLISAIFERDFNFKTLSWWLGEEVTHIEFDTPMITEDQIAEVEETVNGLIRNCTNVSVQVFNETATDEEIKQARSRGLPDDHVGDIRIITIDGIESNMCCGTHVTNLSQLQSIKLLHCEKSKRKNQCLLYFLCGNRILKRLDKSIGRERKLTAILNSGPQQHVELVDKLLKSSKGSTKNLQNVLKDLAALEADKLKSSVPMPKYFCMHRKEAEPDFMNTFIKEFGSTETFLVLSTGEEKGAGNILLYGNEKDIEELGKSICELLNGKGAGKGNRFQAKVANLGNRNKVEELLKKYFN
ncbi:PREDICTED: alanyl-tRNA editing protein Aarsd1 [Nicrophorus vespilloides]|uniref:Alanyl-tRNA editing protein Aarsd1 n=1 Tax=Nicrophorus vespilloides TaxID=110193 RepID=A0ABM1MTT3_NICVS|nr:PREDICTED: alanyl-tRNA editing protein Aarsd1 [Nicrophorus vespilloides]